MTLDQDIVEEIVRRVRSVVAPERIILFGSAATGEMTADSDIDLLILYSGAPMDRKNWLEIERALRGMGKPFDVFFMSVERFEESKNVVGGLAFPAYKYGREVYAAA